MKSKYRGVKYDNSKDRYPSNPWKVQLKSGNRVLSMFRHECEEVCAVAGDFCRYLKYGLDISRWPPHAAKPNFGPVKLAEIDYELLAQRMIDCGVLSEAVILRHLEEYYQTCDRIQKNRLTKSAQSVE